MVIQSKFNFQDCATHQDKYQHYLIGKGESAYDESNNPPSATKDFKEYLEHEVIRANYCNWLAGKGFTHFLTLTYRDAPAYNKHGEPWGGPPSFQWMKKSINYLSRLSYGYCSPAFIVVERGKNPPNLLGLSVPKGTKLKAARS